MGSTGRYYSCCHSKTIQDLGTSFVANTYPDGIYFGFADNKRLFLIRRRDLMLSQRKLSPKTIASKVAHDLLSRKLECTGYPDTDWILRNKAKYFIHSKGIHEAVFVIPL